MSGSCSHIVDSNNKFRGIDLIEDLGEAYEALEECYALIQYLGGNKQKVYRWEVDSWRKSFPDDVGKPNAMPHHLTSFHNYWNKDD